VFSCITLSQIQQFLAQWWYHPLARLVESCSEGGEERRREGKGGEGSGGEEGGRRGEGMEEREEMRRDGQEHT